ncbi:Uncharacterised protein [Streptococcus pneumoniae]|nr:Uncharacterised protein [Streptococcus pneumoniae]
MIWDYVADLKLYHHYQTNVLNQLFILSLLAQ